MALSTRHIEVLLPQAVPVDLVLQQADAVSTASGAVRAATQITLQSAAAVTTASNAPLSARGIITLQSAAAVTTASNVPLSARAYITLQTPAAVSGVANLPLDTPMLIALQSAAAVTTASNVPLSARAYITLQQADAGSSVGVALLSARGIITLQQADAVSTASTATLKALTNIPLATAAAVSSASLAITAKTGIVLQTADAVSTAANLSVAAPVVQYLAPAADSVDGNWLNETNGAALFPSVSDINDSTYIHSESAPSNSSCRLKLAAGMVPDAGPRILRTRHRATGSAVPTDLTVRLYQGGGDVLGAGTLVDSFSHTSIPTSLATVDDLVTGTITNYSDLYVELEAN